MEALTVATYLWDDPASRAAYRYTADDVRLLKRMVDRHMTVPHGFVCVTDQPEAFAPSDGIRTVALNRSAHVPGRIFDKLMTFHPEAGVLIGERILALDLDCVVTGGMDPIVERDDDLVLWRNPARQPWGSPAGKGVRRALYNTSMVLIRAGCRPDVWRGFDPTLAPAHFDGDQDYISAKIGPDCAFWESSRDGVYRLEREDTPGSGITGPLPDNARIVFFAGSEHKPHLPHIAARFPWIAEHRC